MINKLRAYIRPRGFTLIETLVAVLLLTTAIGGPLTLASRGLMVALLSKDQIVAFNLAQDAVEHIRFVRDSNTLSGADWLAGLGNCISVDGTTACYFDSLLNSPASPQTCADATCSAQRLYFDETNRYYNYTTTNTLTIFTRVVTIRHDSGGASPGEAVVTVTVYWAGTGTLARNVVLRESLFNWQ